MKTEPFKRSVATQITLSRSRNFNSVLIQENKFGGQRIEKFRVDSLKAKYIKLMAKNIGACTDWHKGAGSRAWIFSDEISSISIIL